MENMKSAKTSKNDRKSRDFLPAREARRENFQSLRRKVSDWSVTSPGRRGAGNPARPVCENL